MFLMRCLFTMFAEDVELLPKKSFKQVLRKTARRARRLSAHRRPTLGGDGCRRLSRMRSASRSSNSTASSFATKRRLPSQREEIGELRAAASYNWREVDPSIFGALLEQALDKDERRRSGAHYTPRAYVERLVIATVIEPLRAQWEPSLHAPRARGRKGARERRRRAGAVQAIPRSTKLCATRVLDPACGTGNFLYVSLEMMKRLEGEVLEALVETSAARRGLTGWKSRTSIRISSSGWKSTRARRPSRNWCSGSAICNGISGPRARTARRRRSCGVPQHRKSRMRCWKRTRSLKRDAKGETVDRKGRGRGDGRSLSL